MTLQQLEYVLAVNRFGHFAQAADHCGVTQPTLSAMIHKLELELGIRIFDRTKKPIQPTPIGLEVIRYAQNIVQQTAMLRAAVDEGKKAMQGVFRMGMVSTVAPYLMPLFLPRLVKEYPKIDIHISEIAASDILSALHQGDLDAGILPLTENKAMEDLQYATLYYEQFYTYVSPTLPLAQKKTVRKADLKNQTLWLLDEGSTFRKQMAQYCRLGTAQGSHRTYNTGNIETLMRLVEKGSGVTFITELALLQMPEKQHQLVRPFAIPVPTREVVIATHKQFVRTTMLGVIQDLIRTSVPQDMRQLRSTQLLVR